MTSSTHRIEEGIDKIPLFAGLNFPSNIHKFRPKHMPTLLICCLIGLYAINTILDAFVCFNFESLLTAREMVGFGIINYSLLFMGQGWGVVIEEIIS